MRIIITIEDDGGTSMTIPATTPPAVVGAMSDEGPAVGMPAAPDGASMSPAADLLARAAAIGAISAGPAPSLPATSGEPPFQPSRLGSPSATPTPEAFAAGEDLAAGPAPESFGGGGATEEPAD